MAAASANDKKQMEKLKKKQSQINNMQQKMFKPQMLQIGISFIYLIVWFLVLIPVFGSTPMAYIPGIGTIANASFHYSWSCRSTSPRCNPSRLLVPNLLAILRVTLTTHHRHNAHRTLTN